MGGSRGYSTYRGRAPFWKWLVIVFLVLVILAAGAFLFLQKYLVYDDNGQAHLELPWEQGETPTAQPSSDEPEPPPSGDDLVIQQPETTLPDVTKAVLLSEDSTLWSGAVAGLASAGQNSFAVTMKESGGKVLYASTVADKDALDKEADKTTAALPLLLESESHSIARISCFRDEIYSMANLDNAGLKNTGDFIFWDGNNNRWLDPAKADARKYLCDLAAECAAMGFDEILLTDLSYPTVGKLSKIAYGKDVDQAAQLVLFLEELRQALAAHEISLSVELPATLFETGADEKAGLRLADIAQKVDAVYVETTEADYAALSAKLPENVRLVAELSALPVNTELPYLLMEP